MHNYAEMQYSRIHHVPVFFLEELTVTFCLQGQNTQGNVNNGV